MHHIKHFTINVFYKLYLILARKDLEKAKQKEQELAAKAEAAHEKQLALASPFDLNKLVNNHCIPYIKEQLKTDKADFQLLCAKCDYSKAMYRLSADSQTLGYLRLCTSKLHSDCLHNEADCFRYLKSKGVTCIPDLLLQKDLNETISFSLTSPIDGVNDSEISDAMVLDTLRDIQEKTTLCIPFEDSDFCKTLSFVCSKLSPAFCNEYWEKVLIFAKACLDNSKGKLTDFSFAHRDIKKDNYFRQNDSLYLFDLEGSRKTYPLYFDAYFYHIFRYGFQKNTIDMLKQYQWYSDFGLKECLLDILSRSLAEDSLSSHFHKDLVAEAFHMWELTDCEVSID